MTSSSELEESQDFFLNKCPNNIRRILLQTVDQIVDPKDRIKYLSDLQSSIISKQHSDAPYNLSTILNRGWKIISQPISINNLNQEINH